MAEFKNRFGFEWLKEAEPKGPEQQNRPAGPSTLTAAMEETLLTYSRPVLEVLQRSPGRQSQAWEIAKTLNARFDVIIRVLEYLGGKGYLERIAEDPQGNDTIRLTPAGEKLLA